jgi:hypothetical protein
MRVQWSVPPITVGWIIALLVLILCIVLAVVGRMDVLEAGLIGGVALSRLL